MNLRQFARHADNFAKRGASWREQFASALIGDWDHGNLNPNAAKTIASFLDRIADDLDDPDAASQLAQDLRDTFMTTEEVWQ